MMHQTIATTMIISLAALMLGCTANDPVRVEQDFGNSVRHMVDAQTYDPHAAERAGTEPPTELDGQKGQRVLGTYRGDAAKPEEVRRPITIDVGN
jgi:hypothetical protein